MLRTLRQARGLSLTALGARIHYSKGYLSKVELGGKPPTPDLATRCDRALDAGGALERLAADHLARVRSDAVAPWTEFLVGGRPVTIPAGEIPAGIGDARPAWPRDP